MEARNKGLMRNKILSKKYCAFDSNESILSFGEADWSRVSRPMLGGNPLPSSPYKMVLRITLLGYLMMPIYVQFMHRGKQ